MAEPAAEAVTAARVAHQGKVARAARVAHLGQAASPASLESPANLAARPLRATSSAVQAHF